MSSVFCLVMNFSSSFSAEKGESGEIVAQQILARVTVRVRMSEPRDENNVHVACCGAFWWLRRTDNDRSYKAYFKAGAMPAISHDSYPPGEGPTSCYHLRMNVNFIVNYKEPEMQKSAILVHCDVAILSYNGHSTWQPP